MVTIRRGNLMLFLMRHDMPMIRSAVLGAFLALAPLAAAADCAPDKALLRLPDGRTLSFGIEVADDDASRAQGLMYRREVPQGRGMLFVYDRPQRVSFWMRNTLVPLDMLFFDQRGVLRHIHHKARPLDETAVPGAAIGDPDPDRLMVLEIAGGEAARLHLTPGAQLAHPALPQAQAAWPCP